MTFSLPEGVQEYVEWVKMHCLSKHCFEVPTNFKRLFTHLRKLV